MSELLASDFVDFEMGVEFEHVDELAEEWACLRGDEGREDAVCDEVWGV